MNFGKKVWLIGNSSEKSKKTLNKLSKILKAEHFVFDDINPEIVISVGGDGTLLRAMHMYEYQLDRVRFLGVHTGHLGFFQTVNSSFFNTIHHNLSTIKFNFCQ